MRCPTNFVFRQSGKHTYPGAFTPSCVGEKCCYAHLDVDRQEEALMKLSDAVGQT